MSLVGKRYCQTKSIVSSVTHARDELKPTKIQLKGVETMSLMFCPRMPGVRLAEAFMREEELITIQAG